MLNGTALVVCFVTMAFLNGCESGEYVHPSRSLHKAAKIERMIIQPYKTVQTIAIGDSTFSTADRFIVWGSLANADTRENRATFDEFFCKNLPTFLMDTVPLYSMEFYAGCDITNNQNLVDNPRDYDEHTIHYDKLRVYEVRYGKLSVVDEVYDFYQYPEVSEYDYQLYCLPNSRDTTVFSTQ